MCKHIESKHKYFKFISLTRFTAYRSVHQDNPFSIDSYQYLCVRVCVSGVFGLLSWAMILLSCAIPRDRKGSLPYKGVKGGGAYPSAVSNLCIRQDIEDVCRECKVYSACSQSPGRAQRTSTLLPSECPEHKLQLTLECSADGHDKAHTAVTDDPRAAVFGARQASSVSTKDAFMHQEPDASQTSVGPQYQEVFDCKDWKKDIEIAFALCNSLRIIPDVICA